MTFDEVFKIVDQKIKAIEMQAKRPSVIIINDKLFSQLQQDMMFRDASQNYGFVRSPFSLQVYNGVKVVTSAVAETIEVF